MEIGPAVWVPGLVVLLGAALKFLSDKRPYSGRIKDTPAEKLWNVLESRFDKQIEVIDKQTEVIDKQTLVMSQQVVKIDALIKTNGELVKTNEELRIAIEEVRDELRDARARQAKS